MLLSERNLLYSFLSPSCRKINVDGVSPSKLRVNMTEESTRSAFVQSSEREHMKTRSPQYFRNLFAISQWAVRHVEICQGSV